MLRWFYDTLIGLYPARFQRDYREEMLWIFDQEAESRSPYWLVWDAVLSLATREFNGNGTAIPVLAPAGIPHLAELSQPNLIPRYFRKGSLLAILSVGVIFPAIVANGAPSGLVSIPTIHTYKPVAPPDNEIDRRQVRALDLDQDGWISGTERVQEEALRWEPLFLKAEHDGRIAVEDVVALIP